MKKWENVEPKISHRELENTAADFYQNKIAKVKVEQRGTDNKHFIRSNKSALSRMQADY